MVIDMAAMPEARRVAARRVPGRCAYDRGRDPATPRRTMRRSGHHRPRVLALVARGLANGEIAARLFVGETTVKTRLGRILTRLGLRDRIHAAIFAYEGGLVRVGD